MRDSNLPQSAVHTITVIRGEEWEMDDTGGWWLVFIFFSLVDPVVIGAGIAVGLLARRWRHVLLILPLAPATFWLVHTASREVSHFPDLAAPLAIGGAIWSATVFGMKRATLAR